jgi:hypothetical protein
VSELGEQIRGLIDEGMSAVTIEEISSLRDARQNPTRRILSRNTVRRTRWRLVLALVAAFVLAAVGLVLVPTADHIRSGVASAAVLNQLANTASSQTTPVVPGPGEYLYTRSLEGSASALGQPNSSAPRSWAFYYQGVGQDWSTTQGHGRLEFYNTSAPLLMTAADRAGWEAAGAQPIGVGWSAGSPVFYDVAGLPTKAALVKSYLARQPGLGGTTQENSPSWQFSTATEFLAAGASPTQRAALYQFMESIPGVRDLGNSTTLGTHLTGVTLGRPGFYPGSESEALFNLATATILEVRVVVSDAAIYHPWPDARDGETNQYDDFVYVGVAKSDHSPPDGAPELPGVWPPDTSRLPLPGLAYPGK